MLFQDNRSTIKVIKATKGNYKIKGVPALVSSAFGVEVNVKQIRDRLTLLKQIFKDSEVASARGSGVEESVDAVNIQSHYDERERLVREYVALEDHFKSETNTVKTKKKQKDEQLAMCAEEIVRESARRRALRAKPDSDDSVSDCSDADSSVFRCSTVSGASPRTPRSTPKG
eukprot:jgi/Phyca11/117455/e_gw1.33.152.1